jgi:hypothetical protein
LALIVLALVLRRANVIYFGGVTSNFWASFLGTVKKGRLCLKLVMQWHLVLHLFVVWQQILRALTNNRRLLIVDPCRQVNDIVKVLDLN